MFNCFAEYAAPPSIKDRASDTCSPGLGKSRTSAFSPFDTAKIRWPPHLKKTVFAGLISNDCIILIINFIVLFEKCTSNKVVTKGAIINGYVAGGYANIRIKG